MWRLLNRQWLRLFTWPYHFAPPYLHLYGFSIAIQWPNRTMFPQWDTRKPSRRSVWRAIMKTFDCCTWIWWDILLRRALGHFPHLSCMLNFPVQIWNANKSQGSTSTGGWISLSAAFRYFPPSSVNLAYLRDDFALFASAPHLSIVGASKSDRG